MRVAVFCASANEVEPCYFREAGRLGKRIGELGWQLIYGGTNIGLMREVSDATIRQGGEVTGIIPECIRDRGVAAGGLKQLIVAPDMKGSDATPRCGNVRMRLSTARWLGDFRRNNRSHYPETIGSAQ